MFSNMGRIIFYCSLVLMCPAVRKTFGNCGVRKDTRYDSTTDDASLGEFPWQVSVQVTTSHICSGTIISEFWVLSSADCFPEVINERLVVEVGVITVGVAGKVYPVAKVILHEEYQEDTSDNNIALLESSESILYNDVVQPVCFPDNHMLNIDSLVNCWVATWKEEEPDGSNYTALVLKKLPFIPTLNCQVNKTNIMCADISDMELHSACEVDSGDALLCQYAETDAWIVAGIVSNTSFECNSTAIFTRTASYIAWMKDNTMTEGKPVIPEINQEDVSNFTVDHFEEIPPLLFGERSSIINQTSNRESKLESGNRIVIFSFGCLAFYVVL